MPAPFWHLICIISCYYCPWDKFALNLVLILHLKIYAETAHSNGAIWDEFCKQHQHQSIKSTILNARLALFFMQIRCIFNAHFSWVKKVCRRNIFILQLFILKKYIFCYKLAYPVVIIFEFQM